MRDANRVVVAATIAGLAGVGIIAVRNATEPDPAGALQPAELSPADSAARAQAARAELRLRLIEARLDFVECMDLAEFMGLERWDCETQGHRVRSLKEALPGRSHSLPHRRDQPRP